MPTLIIILGYRFYRALTLFFLGTLTFIATFYFTVSYLRYIYPATILLTVVISLAIEKGVLTFGLIGRVVFGFSFVLVLILNILFLNAASYYSDFPIKAMVDESFRRDQIIRKAPERLAVEFINQINLQNKPVIFIGNPFIAGLKAKPLIAEWYNPDFLAKIKSINSDGAAIDLLQEYAVGYLMVDKGWNTQNAQLGASPSFFENVTTEIASFGNLSIREPRHEFLFKNEILKNSNFNG
jgi:hypothetical protein